METDYQPIESAFHFIENGGQLEENPAYTSFRANNCYGVPGKQNPQPRCCGQYPNRLVYNSGIRGCCNEGELFHYGNDVDCCDDGTVIVSGSGRTDCTEISNYYG